jgi:hypothetical protein
MGSFMLRTRIASFLAELRLISTAGWKMELLEFRIQSIIKQSWASTQTWQADTWQAFSGSMEQNGRPLMVSEHEHIPKTT